MLNILGWNGLAYLAGSGTVTNTAVIGRGLFRAARRAVEGDFHQAAAEALGALAAPAFMAYAVTADLVADAFDVARAFSRSAMNGASAGGVGRAA